METVVRFRVGVEIGGCSPAVWRCRRGDVTALGHRDVDAVAEIGAVADLDTGRDGGVASSGQK
jgi:hypothetical protein